MTHLGASGMWPHAEVVNLTHKGVIAQLHPPLPALTAACPLAKRAQVAPGLAQCNRAYTLCIAVITQQD